MSKQCCSNISSIFVTINNQQHEFKLSRKGFYNNYPDEPLSLSDRDIEDLQAYIQSFVDYAMSGNVPAESALKISNVRLERLVAFFSEKGDQLLHLIEREKQRKALTYPEEDACGSVSAAQSMLD